MYIEKIHTISDTSISMFNRELSKVVSEFQREGLKVEIQYSAVEAHGNFTRYTAMIIGKK